MDELRFLWRGVMRTLRWQWRRATGGRRAMTAVLAIALGMVLWLMARRGLSPEARLGLWGLAAGLLTGLAVWFGVRHGRQLGHLYRWAHQLQLYRGEGLWLTYDSELEPEREALYQMARRALRAAEQFLQTPLESEFKRVGVLTPASMDYLNRLYPNRFTVGGWARVLWDTIYVVYHGAPEIVYGTMLHEWAHLIAGQWTTDAPALFREGIAVATQYHEDPLRAHTEALYYLHYYPGCSLISLLRDDRFYDPDGRYATYAWAGSFVLYLIERFGLPRFRRFYHRLVEQPVDEAFQAEFGTNFGQAELCWRDYLATELPEAQRGEARRRALRDSLRWAVGALNGVIIQSLAAQLRREYPGDWLGYYAQGYCAFWQGDLQAAWEAFERANRAPDQEEDALRGRAWFECGMVCDLLGQRARAVECYRRALEYPDDEDPTHAYHARARQYLETPYTYAERYRFLSGS